MALSSILSILLSISLLISIADANVHDACKAAAASNRSINYDFCLTSLRRDPTSEAANARDLAIIATDLCLADAKNTKTRADNLIRMGNQTPEITEILKVCSGGVYTDQIELLDGADDTLRVGRVAAAISKLDTVTGRSHACGDLLSKKGQSFLVAKEESNLEGLSKLGSFLAERSA